MTSEVSADAGCVLIVDDEEDVRESLRDLVEMVGCSALLAGNGFEALALLADHKPCVVILDLLMPGMNGHDTLEAIRRAPELAGTKVIISTSAPERAPAGVPVLAKPLDIDALCSWLRQLCHCG